MPKRERNNEDDGGARQSAGVRHEDGEASASVPKALAHMGDCAGLSSGRMGLGDSFG